jgi:cell division protein FtsQ
LRRAGQLGALGRRLNARMEKFDALRPPRGIGLAAAALIVLGSIVFGVVRGGHVADVIAYLRDVRDTAANAAGFNITGVALAGHKHLTREEIFAIAGVTGHSSLLFLDVADARARLKTNPWIADATVQKLYPDRLQITITEREAFALWQKGGRIGVIADDGTVLEPYISKRFTGLPLFVGDGAATRAKDFLALLDRYPDVRDQLRASVLVAERRWNLRLKNGVDVRLPEFDVARALDQLVALDRDKKILSRDIVSVDLRLSDRVTVRMSEAAAQAREEALKAKKPKPKGGNA